MKSPIRSIALLRESGFSLVELAIVLVIAALLSGGLMLSLAARQEAVAATETQQRLEAAREALLGFAAANGRLPCPAAPGATGTESPPGGGTCTDPWTGFLPAVTLGLTPTDANGYATDGWGNAIRYALTTADNATHCTSATNHCFATPIALRNAWNGGVTLGPNLRVCNTSTGKTGSGKDAACAANTSLVNDAVAVIYSRGKNGAVAPVSNDEKANGDADAVFVFHTPTPPGANEFDDIVTWLSPNILYNRMITAGRLP